MALSRTIIANPLRLSGCGLPPQVVLLCRLIALALLLTNHQRQIQSPFLPFLPVFESVPGELFQAALRVTLILACLGILFTSRVRWFAALAGSALLLAVLSSRTYYGNNKTFTGLLLLLSALSASEGVPRLLHWQVGLVYFGAALNKCLDPDWRSGLFFDHWARIRLDNAAFRLLSDFLPPLAAGWLFSWTTIAAEFAVAILAPIPRFHRYVIWISGLFQASLLLFTGDAFNLFFFSMQAAMFAFVRWPQSPIVVIWDGDCGFCRRTKEFVERLDFDGVLDWVKQQTGIGDRFGISREALRQAVYAAGPHWILSGYEAMRRITLYLPMLWYTLLALLALAPGPVSRRLIAGAALFYLTPLSNIPGKAAYSWVARHRHQLLPTESCAVELEKPGRPEG